MWFVLVVLLGCAGVAETGEKGLSIGEANVAACERYLVSLDCGDFDFGAVFEDDFCDAYGDVSCRIAPYFDCLTEGGSCEDGIYTPAIDCTVPNCEPDEERKWI